MEAMLYLRAYVLMLIYTRVLRGLASSGWVVYGLVHSPRCV
jgi:hypothetical protein